ncbi:MAG: hypothetical protein JWP50_30 [Phenylobacterium sp.]|nr:hypothetical protein [Phenylobacterium sp.]
MKFNMGCGARKLDGYVNVDAEAACAPDEVVDLERTPWPWPDDCAEEIRFIHSLEHMGGQPKVFLAIMREIYRIGAPGCRVVIHVPHPRHDNFISDPTHVRPITPDTMRLFDRRLNDEWKAKGGSNTPFAHYLNVDFALVDHGISLDEPFAGRFERGEITQAEVHELANRQSNVVREFRIGLSVRK